MRSHIIKPSEDYYIVSFLQLLTFAHFRIHKLTVHFSASPHWPPAGAAEPREDCSSGAGEGALAAGGPVREGAAGKGEPAHCGTGSAASSSSRGKSELANGCSRRTHAGPRRRSSGRTESGRKRADAVHEPGTSPWPLGLLFAFTLQGNILCPWHWFVSTKGVLLLFSSGFHTKPVNKTQTSKSWCGRVGECCCYSVLRLLS